MSASLSTLAGAALGFADVGATFARFLRPASIRGVGFWIVASEDATTRRWIAHEFPGRDEPWHEDLGAGPAPLQLEGLLIGADVVSQAERLRRACRSPSWRARSPSARTRAGSPASGCGWNATAPFPRPASPAA
jgi:hypothetical protein